MNKNLEILEKGILAELAYLKLEDNWFIDNNKSIYNIEDIKKFILLSKNKENIEDGIGISGIEPERKETIINILDKYEILKFTSDSLTDFQAMLLKNNETGEYVVSFRGTAGWIDGVVDAMSSATYNPQINKAIDFVNSILNDPNLNVTKENLFLTGHSLGGILTQLVGATLRIPGCAYNPWGTSSLLKYNNGLPINILIKILEVTGLYTSEAELFARNNIVNISYQDEGLLNGDILSNLATGIISEHMGSMLPIFYRDVGISGHSILIVNEALKYYNSVISKFSNLDSFENLTDIFLITKRFQNSYNYFQSLDIFNQPDKSLFLLNLTDKSIEELCQSKDPAILYALENLSSVAVLGNISLYNQINLDNYTENYLKDRASMLFAYLHPELRTDGIGTKYIDYNTSVNVLDTKYIADKIIAFGTNKNDIINGTMNNDRLYGLEGEDTLNGGYGDDYLVGGFGNDTYIIKNKNSQIFELENQGIDTINSFISIDLNDYNNVENIQLVGIKSINATGNNVENTIIGSGGRNTLDGGLGHDILIGGEGDDTYIINDNDTIIEAETDFWVIGGGFDTVISSIDYTLPENVEKLILKNGASGTGNNLSNIIIGDEGNNNLYGEEGGDVLSGGLGNNNLYGGNNKNDTFIISQTAHDTIYDYKKNDLILFNFSKTNKEFKEIDKDLLIIIDDEQKTSVLIKNGADKKEDIEKSIEHNSDILYNNFSTNVSLRKRDPIVLDLNNNGTIDSIGIEDSNVFFDMSNSGLKEKISWINNTDGFLVLDENNDGQITNLSELFGSHTETGFGELKAYDLNQDNIIDKNDEIFEKIQIWNDLNNNGLTENGELKNLEEYNFTSFNLTTNKVNIELAAGSISETSTATQNEISILTADINLIGNVSYTTREYDYTKLDLTTFSLPNLRGYGKVEDIIFKYNEDTNFRTFVESFINKNYITQKEFTILLSKWSGLENITGETLNTGDLQFYDKAWILETFMGTEDLKLNIEQHYLSGKNIDSIVFNKTLINSNFDLLFNKLYNQFFIQAFGNKLSGVSYSIKTDSFYVWNRDYLINSISTNFSVDDGNLINVIYRLRDYIDLNISEFNKDTLGFDKFTNLSALLDRQYQNIYLNDNIVNYSNNIIYQDTNSGIVKGNDLNDYILSSKGDDTIYTGSGNDVLFFEKNHGKDIIKETNYYDVINFGEGISKDTMQIKQNGNNLIIYTSKDLENYIVVENFFYSLFYRPKSYNFSDGTSLLGSDILTINSIYEGTNDNDTITTLNGNNTIYSKEGNDTITAGFGNDLIYTGNGNNTINSKAGNDQIYTGDGIDIINGGDGNDIINAGKGNDFIFGGLGADTFIFEEGHGIDIIRDEENIDKIKFGEGISISDISVKKTTDGKSLTIYTSIDQQNSITLDNWYYFSSKKINSFEFSDGTILNSTQIIANSTTNYTGTSGNDIITGLSSNDIIFGLEGNDTIKGDYGNNIINGGKGSDIITTLTGNDTFIYNKGDGADIITDTGGTDKLKLNALSSDISFYTSGYDLYLNYSSDKTDSVKITNFKKAGSEIEKVELDNGTFLTNVDINNVIQQMTAFGSSNGIAINSFDNIKNNQTLTNLIANSFHS